MDFKKFASNAAHKLSRVVQLTEEKLGHGERTEYDPEFLALCSAADRTRDWTERLIAHTEAVLQPNPGTRLQVLISEKLDRPVENLIEVERLADVMAAAGAEFGSQTPYGVTLGRVSNAERELGRVHRNYMLATNTSFLVPLKAFLDGDMKNIEKERKILEERRLDLDACKNRLRKARAQSQQANVVSEVLGLTENEVRFAQAEFDKQLELTKLLMESLSTAHTYHLRCLHDFTESQYQYFTESSRVMGELQRQMSGLGFSAGSSLPPPSNSLGGAPPMFP